MKLYVPPFGFTKTLKSFYLTKVNFYFQKIETKEDTSKTYLSNFRKYFTFLSDGVYGYQNNLNYHEEMKQKELEASKLIPSAEKKNKNTAHGRYCQGKNVKLEFLFIELHLKKFIHFLGFILYFNLIFRRY
jgi:hypothetical protein